MNSREAFEKWAKKEGYRVFSDARGSYDMSSTNCAWLAWKAATERAAEICQDEMDEQFCDSDAWYSARNCRNNIREGND